MAAIAPIITRGERVVDLAAPTAASITASDVARGVSTKYRYAGHLRGGLLTVAEHLVIVSFCVPERARPRALLHDAAEGYMCDVPSPLKMLPELAGYCAIEDNLQRLIYRRFGLLDVDVELDALVHEADMRIRRDEIDQLGGPGLRERAAKIVGYGHAMLCLEPLDAERAWLSRFRELFGRRYWS